MSPFQWLCGVAVAALAAGCASAPAPLAPVPASVAIAWQAPLPQLPHGGSSSELPRWWSQFNDPTLPALIAAAQETSPTLASARTLPATNWAWIAPPAALVIARATG